MMKEYLLEHKGYKCIAKLYEDGRWGFGSGPKPNDESEFPFFWYADNIEEAKVRFATSIDRMNNKNIKGKMTNGRNVLIINQSQQYSISFPMC